MCFKCVMRVMLFQDVTADEFHLLMDLLGWTRLSRSVTGQKEMVDIVADQMDLNQEFNASDEDQVDRLIYGLRHALPYFSVSVWCRQTFFFRVQYFDNMFHSKLF